MMRLHRGNLKMARTKKQENKNQWTHKNEGIIVGIVVLTLLKCPKPFDPPIVGDFRWGEVGHGADVGLLVTADAACTFVYI